MHLHHIAAEIVHHLEVRLRQLLHHVIDLRLRQMTNP